MTPLPLRQRLAELPPYRWNGVLLQGGTPKAIQSLLQRNNFITNEFAGTEAGFAIVDHPKPWVLWVQDPTRLSELAHEAFHIVVGVLAQRGLALSGESEEAYAYALTYIIDQFTEKKGWKRIER